MVIKKNLYKIIVNDIIDYTTNRLLGQKSIKTLSISFIDSGEHVPRGKYFYESIIIPVRVVQKVLEYFIDNVHPYPMNGLFNYQFPNGLYHIIINEKTLWRIKCYDKGYKRIILY